MIIKGKKDYLKYKIDSHFKGVGLPEMKKGASGYRLPLKIIGF